MYGLAGERRLTEWTCGGSRAMRIAPGAHRQCRADQLQLDVFGEVMDALHQARKGGWPRTRTAGLFSRHCSHISRRSGSSRTRASGKCAAGGGTSPIRRSWRGSRSTARVKSIDNWPARPARSLARDEQKIHDDVCRQRLDAAWQLRAELWLEGARRQPSPDTEYRFSAGSIRGSAARSTRSSDELVVDGSSCATTPANARRFAAGRRSVSACSFWLADAYIARPPRRGARTVRAPARPL